MICTHSLQNTQHADSIDISSKLWGIKANLYVTLCCEVIYFCRLNVSHQFYERHRITHVCIVKVEIRLAFKMSDALAEIY